jgi:excisionase family DNA binding protein
MVKEWWVYMTDDQEKDNNASSSESQPLWTVKDAAEYLRLKPETIRQMARRGELPCIRVGKRLWRFRKASLMEYLIRKT